MKKNTETAKIPMINPVSYTHLESGTRTFYLTGTSAKNVEITAQRVTEPHENEKGYYQIGKRWYHICLLYTSCSCQQ